jgi:hypothetical protein
VPRVAGSDGRCVREESGQEETAQEEISEVVNTVFIHLHGPEDLRTIYADDFDHAARDEFAGAAANERA